MSEQATFDELATRYGYTGPSSAKAAYDKAVHAIGELLWKDGWARAVNFRRISKKKTAAVYQYQADFDGEWGEIVIDIKNRTAEIHTLADWDSTKFHRYVKELIRRLLDSDKLPKSGTFYFP